MKSIFIVHFVGDPTRITRRDGTSSNKQVIQLRELGGKYEDCFAVTYFGGEGIFNQPEGTAIAAAIRAQVRVYEGLDYQDMVLQEYVVLTPRYGLPVLPKIPTLPQLPDFVKNKTMS